MEVSYQSKDRLHIYISPGMKSWSILAGAISLGIGAAYSSPEEHIFIKTTCLIGCLILGLNFLDDWEDCIFDQKEGKVILSKTTWFEKVTHHQTSSNVLVLDSTSILDASVRPISKGSHNYHIVLQLSSGAIMPISEAYYPTKSDLENLASLIRSVLSLNRIQELHSVPGFHNQDMLVESNPFNMPHNMNKQDCMEDGPKNDAYYSTDSDDSEDIGFDQPLYELMDD